MKQFIFSTFFLLSASITINAQYSVADHILSFDSFTEASQFLNDEHLKGKEKFKKYFLSLSKKNKEKVLNGSKAMEAYLPEYYL